MSITVSLEPFTSEHVAQTYTWVQDPGLRDLFLMRGEVTWENHRAYFDRVLNDPNQRVYAILADGVHVGNCGLKNISHIEKEAELWIYIGDPEFRSKGIGKRATELLVGEAFGVLGLNKLCLHVADFNSAARRLYDALGFQEVHLHHDAAEWEEHGCEIIRMEVLK